MKFPQCSWRQISNPIFFLSTMQPEYTLTCTTCHVAFASAEPHRTHYKSEWHKYNLKRKSTGLPPIPETTFNSLNKPPAALPCARCNKEFASPTELATHTKTCGKESSFAYRLAYASTEEELQALIDEKIANSPTLTEKDCLFCSHTHETIDETLAHMQLAHTFFIPETCIDIPGLLTYLGEKVAIGNVCLYCPSRTFHSLSAVRNHMIEKGHTKLAEDYLEEIGDYFDEEYHEDALSEWYSLI